MSSFVSRPGNFFTTTNLTPLDSDHLMHRDRCHAHSSYRGPIHSVENVYVPCGWCGTPVDPVTRVPVGRMFLHPQCLRCVVCGKLGSRTLPFVARQGQPVCANCDKNKSVSLPPLKAAAFQQRAAALQQGSQHVMRALMERSAVKSPTRRGHAIEMQQLSVYQRDPNILLISAEKCHEVDNNLTNARQILKSQTVAAHSVATQFQVTHHQQQQQQQQQVLMLQQQTITPSSPEQANASAKRAGAMKGGQTTPRLLLQQRAIPK